MWNGESVLVAGGSGLVGVNLVERLRKFNCSIKSTYLTHKPPIIHDDVEYIQVDLQNENQVDAVVQDIDYAFLLAASTSGAATISSTPMIHVTPNVLINTLFFDACYREKVKKVLWLSSTTGYPVSGDMFVEEDMMFEGDPFEKYYFVGWMKRFTEILCNMYSNKLSTTMPIVVLRPTNIYGPYDKFDPERSHVLPALVRKVVEGQDPIEVWGDGKDERDFIYVDDMVSATVLAMEKIHSYDPINIGYGTPYTVNDILKIMLKLSNREGVDVSYKQSKPTMIPKRRVSISKAKKLLGFAPKISIEDGIERTMEFYRNHPCE